MKIKVHAVYVGGTEKTRAAYDEKKRSSELTYVFID